MVRKRELIILVCVVLILGVVREPGAAYFVFNKKANIRSGPGTKYRVIGQLAKETIAEIPETFTDYEAKWIAIDAKTRSDKQTQAQEVVYTKWVHRSLGVVVKGDINEVDKYFAIRESDWSKEMQNLVLAGKVEVGMTTHMVFYALGRPDEVTESTTAKQQWVYKKPGTQPRHLYFEDGILTNMSN
ncbi:MAG: hypothetical protein JSV14_15045 [Deltaproteobacteria bacterium]|jgi:hypothetical protein|nr:MAG: hypothetical protein JSV14_15045 [Deltaproteobacteria bacterium]